MRESLGAEEAMAGWRDGRKKEARGGGGCGEGQSRRV